MNRRLCLLAFAALALPLTMTVPAAAADGADDLSAEQWLERIDERADEIDAIRADVRYDRIKDLLGDRQRRFGTLYYDAGPPAKFAVHFDRLIIDGGLREQDRWYIFDGRWLAEKRVDEQVFVRREIVPAGEEKNLLELGGQGPFVLPLNQDKDHVLRRFDVELVAPEEDDPDNSVHLRLTPKPELDIDLKQVDLWYDRDSLLPARVTTEPGEQERTIVTLLEIEQDADVGEGRFDTTPPDDPQWDVQIKRLEDDGDAAD